MRKNLLLAIAFALGIWAYLLMYAAASARQNTGNRSPLSDPEDGITVLFSPSGGCTNALVAEINKATKTLDIEAYSFTSAPIADAVAAAFDRGVRVRLVVDKVRRTERASSVNFFISHHITVFVDDKHTIAHNKVMMIDGRTLITGSFNFTKDSEDKNAENLLIIHDRPKLLGSYGGDFERHLAHSVPINPPGV